MLIQFIGFRSHGLSTSSIKTNRLPHPVKLSVIFYSKIKGKFIFSIVLFQYLIAQLLPLVFSVLFPLPVYCVVSQCFLCYKNCTLAALTHAFTAYSSCSSTLFFEACSCFPIPLVRCHSAVLLHFVYSTISLPCTLFQIFSHSPLPSA